MVPPSNCKYLKRHRKDTNMLVNISKINNNNNIYKRLISLKPSLTSNAFSVYKMPIYCQYLKTPVDASCNNGLDFILTKNENYFLPKYFIKNTGYSDSMMFHH